MPNLKTLANPFQFNKKDIRTAVDEEDKVWFFAKDICETLDIDWDRNTLNDILEEWIMVVNFTTKENGMDCSFINEPGLYRLIFQSNKPRVIEFSRWVYNKVLPTIKCNNI